MTVESGHTAAVCGVFGYFRANCYARFCSLPQTLAALRVLRGSPVHGSNEAYDH
ncbi:hypothetical protein [Lacipirellula parvula]|uniref:hypothetical protein n=1 Tax=Lacipirellula parvula TaxID=2650471 RepID=UPI001561CD36|nr:hypothetical protein [Lacipirellula parvula]